MYQHSGVKYKEETTSLHKSLCFTLTFQKTSRCTIYYITATIQRLSCNIQLLCHMHQDMFWLKRHPTCIISRKAVQLRRSVFSYECTLLLKHKWVDYAGEHNCAALLFSIHKSFRLSTSSKDSFDLICRQPELECANMTQPEYIYLVKAHKWLIHVQKIEDDIPKEQSSQCSLHCYL
ncbi:Hypothetical_protein [Hexamita inflata]|uniref:Hypothetical_protein n=1 Tax=Hexamita inflata TaxID=28002 RepID=A0AA86VM25_9EUKA|nr:Hypothetical protein HINF_LOCUS58188 [Hexamita inflata]